MRGMQSAPQRGLQVADKGGVAEPRFIGWMEAITRAVNAANHPGFSQIIDASRGDAELTYTGGVLTRVTYADTSTKDFEYTAGVLTKITDSDGDDLEFTFTGGQLTAITVTSP